MKRILVIDDDELTVSALNDYLHERLGAEIHHAKDPEEAGALLDCYSYQVVITDLQLSHGEMQGLELIARIADTSPRPRIITLTGHANSELEDVARDRGSDLFLAKPISLLELTRVIRELIQQHANTAGAGHERNGQLLEHLFGPKGVTIQAQPIVRLRNNHAQTESLEFLARGPIGTPFHSPDVLFAYARRKHAEVTVDKHCVSLALAAARDLPRSVRLSFNVHASTLGRDAVFPQWLHATAVSNTIEPGRITIEIVEHAPTWNKAEFLRSLAELRRSGIRIALDDIGLGHSNYQMIVDARPEYFKVDRYFVHGCTGDRYRCAVIRSITSLARDFGAEVVAEGIETSDDRETICKLGIDLLQGHIFSRPVSVSELVSHCWAVDGDCGHSMPPFADVHDQRLSLHS